MILDDLPGDNKEELNAEILEGHLSSALCHTGNISYRLGEQSPPDRIRERIRADRDAESTFDRMSEHRQLISVLRLTREGCPQRFPVNTDYAARTMNQAGHRLDSHIRRGFARRATG